MKDILSSYRMFVRSKLFDKREFDDNNLYFWQDQLFSTFLFYCFPVGLLALIPGVYMAIHDGVIIIAVVDLICFFLLVFVTFSPKISSAIRKITVVSIFYFLAVFLINSLGYLGPGVFYLFFITLLTALIFPIRYAYWSVVVNAMLLAVFAAIIKFRWFNSALITEYSTGKWIAFSVNLVFASIIIVILIDRILHGLQLTISHKSQLQERYKNIFDKSPLPMWLFDTDTLMFLDVNEAAIRNYGYTQAEFRSMSIVNIRSAAKVSDIEELVKANKISGKYYHGNSQHIKKNGETIYVKIESELLDIDGRKVRLVLATDITTEVEHQLRVFEFNAIVQESESNLRAVFESSVDGFVLLNKVGIIKAFNSKASDALKFNKDQKRFEVGRSIFDYVATSRLTYFEQIMSKVYLGETVDYDRRFRSDEGTLNWIRYTLTPVIENGVITGACISGRDITARKLYLKSVEEQNRVFRDISWMQSHLVRAPLARIMGLLPILKSATAEAEKEEIINYLDRSANELDEVIMQITEKSNKILLKYPEALHGE